MENKSQHMFSVQLGVRDYELDFQGIVNNAVYMNYLEHARHEYLLSKAINISDLHNQGIDLVVTNVEIRYKHSLKNNDQFSVTVSVKYENEYKMVFEQKIFREADNKLMLTAKISGVCLKEGKLSKLKEALNLQQMGLV